MNKVLLVLLMIFVTTNAYAEKNKDGKPVIRGTFIFNLNSVDIELFGDKEDLIKFDEFVRTVENKNWRNDLTQIARHKFVIESIEKYDSSLMAVAGDANRNSSGKKLQNALNKIEEFGEFIIENPLPSTKR
jgi:hypothetical protein